MTHAPTPPDQVPEDLDRRTVLSGIAGIGMALGLTGTASGLAAIAGQFLYPTEGRPTAWLYVGVVSEIASGVAIPYVGPLGEKIAIARQADSGEVDDFIALSSTCPHLGCQVHWEAQHNRFFCPCHNGAFDPQGTATEGPPAKAKQKLARYPLKIENGLLFIEVPVPAHAG